MEIETAERMKLGGWFFLGLLVGAMLWGLILAGVLLFAGTNLSQFIKLLGDA